MRDNRERIEATGAGVVVIGLGTPEQAAYFCDRRHVPFPCVVAPDRSAHRAFGLHRGTFQQVAGPRVWLPWARNAVTGTLQGRPAGDMAQLAGTFVVDAAGVVRFVHRAQLSSEMPSMDGILRALAEVGGPT